MIRAVILDADTVTDSDVSLDKISSVSADRYIRFQRR